MNRTFYASVPGCVFTLLVALASAQNASPTPPKTTVLFLCPHGAAKSVLASAYFQRLAKERGLNVRVESAGTEPEPAVSASVAKHLIQIGYAIPIEKPRAVNPQDLAVADVVISIGCDLSGLPKPRGTLKEWDDVPPLSDDFAKAEEAIRARVVALIEELVRAKR